MNERNDPKAAADILVKEFSAKKVPFENIVTGIMMSLLTSTKASVKYTSSFIEEEEEKKEGFTHLQNYFGGIRYQE